MMLPVSFSLILKDVCSLPAAVPKPTFVKEMTHKAACLYLLFLTVLRGVVYRCVTKLRFERTNPLQVVLLC